MLCKNEFKFFFARGQTSNVTLEILVVCHNLEKCMDVVINGKNIETAAFVARGLEPLVVDYLNEVA